MNTFLDLVGGAVVVEGQVHADLGTQRFGKFDRHFRCIDLFVWVHSWGRPEVLYNRVDEKHLQTLTRLLHNLPLQAR